MLTDVNWMYDCFVPLEFIVFQGTVHFVASQGAHFIAFQGVVCFIVFQSANHISKRP